MSSLDGLPIWAAAIILIPLVAAVFYAGTQIRRRGTSQGAEDDAGQEGLLISAVLGLLALLLGFNFSLAIDRFETRRLLVLEEANAIRTAYLQAQTFDDPDRAVLSGLLVSHVDNRLAIGLTDDRHQAAAMAAQGEALRRSLWAATVRAVNLRRDDISSTFMSSMSNLNEVAAARRTERDAHVPRRVFAVLLAYMLVSAGGLGFIFGGRYRVAVGIVLVLAAISYLLIVDIDGATGGGVRESQRPMEDLKAVVARNGGGPGPPSRGTDPAYR